MVVSAGGCPSSLVSPLTEAALVPVQRLGLLAGSVRADRVAVATNGRSN